MRIARGAWRRAAGALGLLFAALGVMVGYGLEHTTSDASGHQDLPGDASGQLLAGYIVQHQSDFNLTLVIGGLLVVVLISFVTAVHEHLSTSGRPFRPFGVLMYGAAFFASSLLLITDAAEYAMINVTPRSDTESLRVLWQFTFAAEAPVAFALGLLMVATGAAMWRSRALPSGSPPSA